MQDSKGGDEQLRKYERTEISLQMSRGKGNVRTCRPGNSYFFYDGVRLDEKL